VAVNDLVNISPCDAKLFGKSSTGFPGFTKTVCYDHANCKHGKDID